jgi:hypothetical protein
MIFATVSLLILPRISTAGTSSPQTPRAVVPPAPIPPPAEAGFRIRSDPVVAQAMRNTIREILASLDPYAEMEPEFEDVGLISFMLAPSST